MTTEPKEGKGKQINKIISEFENKFCDKHGQILREYCYWKGEDINEDIKDFLRLTFIKGMNFGCMIGVLIGLIISFLILIL